MAKAKKRTDEEIYEDLLKQAAARKAKIEERKSKDNSKLLAERKKIEDAIAKGSARLLEIDEALGKDSSDDAAAG